MGRKYNPGDCLNDNVLLERCNEPQLSRPFQNGIFLCPAGHKFKGNISSVACGRKQCPHCFPKQKTSKYKNHSYIGDYGVYLIEKTTQNENYSWNGRLICPYCGKEFEHSIAPIVTGAVKSCGCLKEKHQFKRKYKPGDLLGPKKIEFLGYTGEKDSSGSLMGRFQCPHCSNTYTTRVSRVSNGEGHFDCGCQAPLRRKNVGRKNIKNDLLEKRFGRLLVKARTEQKDQSDGTYLWQCLCDCGTMCLVSRGHLVSNNTRSCGCLNRDTSSKAGKANAKDLSGELFGFLEPLYRDGTTIRGKTRQHTAATWTCLCHNCGNEVSGVISSDLTSGNRISCGECQVSKGEMALFSALAELKIPYEAHRTFDTCRNPATGYMLIFDCYLPSLGILVEYDGIQHYQPDSRQGAEQFAAANARDVLKNEWCAKNGIPLIRIPYTELSNLDASYLSVLIAKVVEEGESVFVPLAAGAADERPAKF